MANLPPLPPNFWVLLYLVHYCQKWCFTRSEKKINAPTWRMSESKNEFPRLMLWGMLGILLCHSTHLYGVYWDTTQIPCSPCACESEFHISQPVCVLICNQHKPALAFKFLLVFSIYSKSFHCDIIFFVIVPLLLSHLLCQRKHSVTVFLSLAYFTQQDHSQVHPFLCKWHSFILLDG